MNLLETLENTFKEFFTIIPNLAAALAVLIIGWIVARIVSRLTERLLKAVRVDVIGEKLNEIDMLQSANITIKPSLVMGKLVYYVLMLIFIASASDILALDIVSEQVEQLIKYIPRILSATLILIAGLIIANLIKGILNTVFDSLGIVSGKLISVFVFYFIFISVALGALTQADFEIKFLEKNLTIIIAGIVLAFSVGYGFASRHIMANLLGALYSRNKFHVGDDIKVDGIRGTIIEMDSTSVTLQTSDRRVIIPLNQLTQEKVELFGDWDKRPLLKD